MNSTPLLILGIFLFSCSGIQEKNTDHIRPYKQNPHYWQYKGQPVLLAGGTDDDNLFQMPHLKSHLDSLAMFGGNYIRNTMSSRVDKGWEIYRFKQLPDGKYDLDQWNDEYWNRFSNLLQWCYERDIIIQIEVWDRFDYSRDHWLPNPWNPVNNINYTYEETGFLAEYPKHPGQNEQPFFHTIPGTEKYQPKYDLIRTYQEKFLDKLLSLSLPYGNVLYCMNNETSTSPRWGQYWMRYIRSKADELGVNVFVTDMFDDFWRGEDSDKVRLVFDNPDMYQFADISQVNSRNFDQVHWERMRWLVTQADENPRPCNNTKIYGSGFTGFGSGSPQDGVERFWRNIFGGCASVRFHRPTSGNGLNDLAQGSLKALRKMESFVKMWQVEPHMELLSNREDDEAYCVAEMGHTYAVYFTDGGSVTVDLSSAETKLTLKWINIFTGEWGEEQTVNNEDSIELSPPSAGGWLVILVNKTTS